MSAPSAALPPVLARWLGCLERNDLDGLLALYHPQAEIDVFAERPRGHREIRALLQPYWSRLKGVKMVAVNVLASGADRLAFETTVASPFGKARLRHEWALEGPSIRSHGLVGSCERDRPPAERTTACSEVILRAHHRRMRGRTRAGARSHRRVSELVLPVFVLETDEQGVLGHTHHASGI